MTAIFLSIGECRTEVAEWAVWLFSAIGILAIVGLWCAAVAFIQQLNATFMREEK